MTAEGDVSVIEVALGERSYPVVVGRGVLGAIASHVTLPTEAGTALVVTQQPVIDAGHVVPVEEALSEAGVSVRRQVVPDGEGAKDPAVLTSLWRAAAQVPLTRADLVVAVGGGVVGDLAGFLAATYNRGIAVIQVPTTLLAQVDAAIGGKTGINLPEGKNLVGAFHQPIGVVCDVSVLDSLPERTFSEGLGEVVKCGLIRDPEILSLIESVGGTVPGVPGVVDQAASGALEAVGGGLRGAPEVVDELVRRSVAVKAAVVGADEKEGGLRAILNFGHTYGHVVEKLTGYGTVLHGEAVAIGMVVALRLGERLGRTPASVVARGEAVIASVGLPVRGPELDRDEVWTVMARDKKAGREGVRFVVLDEVGAPAVVTPSRADVDAVLDGFKEA